MGVLKANQGIIRCNVTPRHALSNLSYGQSEEYIFDLYEDTNNYIRLWREDGALGLAYNANGGGEQTDTHPCGWLADNNADVQVEYGASGATVTINGVERFTVAGAVAFASDFTQAIKWGHKQDGTAQFDGTFQGWQDVADPTDWWQGGKYTVGDSGVLAAYEPKGAADQAASYVDKSGNGNDAGVGVAPTWDAVNGWKFNGTTQYLTTGVVPTNAYSMIAQFSNRSTSGSSTYLAGECNAANSLHFGMSPRRFGTGGFVNGSTIAALGAAQDQGNIAIAHDEAYQDGLSVGAVTAGAIDTHDIYIGASNRNTTATYFWGGYVQAFAICRSTNIAEQIATVAAAMAAL